MRAKKKFKLSEYLDERRKTTKTTKLLKSDSKIDTGDNRYVQNENRNAFKVASKIGKEK